MPQSRADISSRLLKKACLGVAHFKNMGGQRPRIEGPFYGCEPLGKQGVVVALLGSSQDDLFNQLQVITQKAGNEVLLSN